MANARKQNSAAPGGPAAVWCEGLDTRQAATPSASGRLRPDSIPREPYPARNGTTSTLPCRQLTAAGADRCAFSPISGIAVVQSCHSGRTRFLATLCPARSALACARLGTDAEVVSRGRCAPIICIVASDYHISGYYPSTLHASGWDRRELSESCLWLLEKRGVSVVAKLVEFECWTSQVQQLASAVAAGSVGRIADVRELVSRAGQEGARILARVRTRPRISWYNSPYWPPCQKRTATL